MKAEIRFVQLEPAAFLSDIDFQMMSAEERGVYFSLILCLYSNGGKLKIENDHQFLCGGNNAITLLSNCTKTGKDWENIWRIVQKKFKIKNNIITHKRVTREINKARNYRNKKSLAGKIGMKHRYNSVSNSDITKEKEKEKESKYNSKGKGIDCNVFPSSSFSLSPSSVSDSFKKQCGIFLLKLSEIFPNQSESDQTTFANIARHLEERLAKEPDIFEQALEQARRSRRKSKPHSYFVGCCKKRWGFHRR